MAQSSDTDILYLSDSINRLNKNLQSYAQQNESLDLNLETFIAAIGVFAGIFGNIGKKLSALDKDITRYFLLDEKHTSSKYNPFENLSYPLPKQTPETPVQTPVQTESNIKNAVEPLVQQLQLTSNTYKDNIKLFADNIQLLLSSNSYLDSGIKLLESSIKLLISKIDNLTAAIVGLLEYKGPKTDDDSANLSIVAKDAESLDNAIVPLENSIEPLSTAIDHLRDSVNEFSDTIDAEFTVLRDRFALNGPAAGGGGAGAGGGGGGGGGNDTPPPIPPDDEGKNFWSMMFEYGKRFGEMLYELGKSAAPALKRLNQQFENFKQELNWAYHAQSVVSAGYQQLSKVITTLTKEFVILSAAAAFFVNAFAPAYVEQFLYTLKDLQAVIGIAFLPLLQAFTNLARFVADILLPLMEEINPIFQELSLIIINLLAPIIVKLASILNQVLPYMGAFALALGELSSSVGNLVANILQGMFPIIEGFIEGLSKFVVLINFILPYIEWFGYIIGTVISGYVLVSFIAAIYSAIAALVTFAASLSAASLALALFTGGLSLVVGGLAWLVSWLFSKKRQEPKYKPNVSQGIAARQAQYMSAEDISKNLIKAAFAGPNADRLKNIDMNGRRQVELLEQIANKKNPVVVNNNNNQRGLAAA